MLPEVKTFLTDAIECARSIEDGIRGRTFVDFMNDRLFRQGIYYEFTIIGEALTQTRRLDPTTFDRISNSPRIVGFRNQVVHGYQKLHHEVSWQIIQAHLPTLIDELTVLIEE